MRSRPLTIFQANAGKSRPNHLLALQLAYEHHFDIVCIQEPWILHSDYTRKFTSTHPAYETHVPLDVWQKDSFPRVVSYTRKGAGISADQMRPFGPQADILALEINGITIFNIYNDKGPDNAAKVLQAAPAPRQKTLLLGDFNMHHRWEPSVERISNGAGDFTRWADTGSLLLLNPVDQATHDHGHVLDLVFST